MFTARIAVKALLLVLMLPLSMHAAPLHGEAPEVSRLFTVPTRTVYGGLLIAHPSAARQPRVGLALAGGGARAAASIGVLKVLRQEGIGLSAIAGTSMGAIVGGLAAAGYSPGEIERIFLENDLNDLFTDAPSRSFLTQEQKETGDRHLLRFSVIGGRFMPPSGLTAGQKLANLLRDKTLAASLRAGLDFDRLAVPFRAVATNIETGSEVVLGKGFLSDALRASSAIPVVFQPVDVGGRLLVDGALSNNLPVDVVRSMGVDLVVAVDPSSLLDTREQLATLVQIMGQSIAIPVRRETERQAARADLVIIPDTRSYSFADFDKIESIIALGEAAARASLPRLGDALRSRAPRPPSPARYALTDLSVRGADGEREQQIRDALAPVRGPAGATDDDIAGALERVYRLGFFSAVSLELARRGDGWVAVVSVTQNPVVTAVRISGTALIPASEIMAGLEDQLTKVLNAPKVLACLDGVVQRYRDRGFLLVSVRSAAMEADGSTLGIVLSEGRVDGISMTGQRRTQPSLVRREMETARGSPLNFRTLEEDVQRLYGLGYFESLTVDITESAQGGVLLLFKVKERPRGTVRLGLRYDLDDSFTGLADLVVDNLAGAGIKVFLETRFGNYRDLALGYHSPVFVNTYFVHGLQAFYRDRTYDIYQNKTKVAERDVSRVGADFSFGYQWFRFGDTYLRYRFESDRTVDALGSQSFDNPLHIGSLAFLSTVDTRDSSTFPRSGFLFKGSYETASESYGGNVDFRKTSLFGQGSFSFADRHTVLADLSAGLGSGALPYQEQFGVGGAGYLLAFPLPGYHRREFVGANELGASLTYRWMISEYRLNVLKALYLVLSGGAANAWNARDQMALRDLRYGAGIGLHADTIVGPVRLDLGAGEDHRYLVYFSAGFDF